MQCSMLNLILLILPAQIDEFPDGIVELDRPAESGVQISGEQWQKAVGKKVLIRLLQGQVFEGDLISHDAADAVVRLSNGRTKYLNKLSIQELSVVAQPEVKLEPAPETGPRQILGEAAHAEDSAKRKVVERLNDQERLAHERASLERERNANHTVFISGLAAGCIGVGVVLGTAALCVVDPVLAAVVASYTGICGLLVAVLGGVAAGYSSVKGTENDRKMQAIERKLKGRSADEEMAQAY